MLNTSNEIILTEVISSQIYIERISIIYLDNLSLNIMVVINRVCLCYLITTCLISAFVYTLIYHNLLYMKKIQKLSESVDEIAHVVFQTPKIGREAYDLSELVDDKVKKRLTGIWNELFALKKMIKRDDKSRSKNEISITKLEERVNYASDQLGAKIVHLEATPHCPSNFIKSWMGADFLTNPPIKLLQSGMEPGNCFTFKNDEANVTIQLAHSIFIDEILLDHITKKQSPIGDTSSAPKDFRIVAIHGDLYEIPLGNYKFNNDPDEPLQRYAVETPHPVEFLRLEFKSNHGNPNYTSIYRVAVFGKL
ncbi:SUN domain-containing protein 5 [Stomoxys calcitrans]|uniref:SUN domain-containing protein n=1 Tax=Stomoxys calcitrans TaxID=35570 RepID=A0A1I8NX62_STOCA|nr:SUN domain-containing protein 5 [Stomoxys calcitrans]